MTVALGEPTASRGDGEETAGGRGSCSARLHRPAPVGDAPSNIRRPTRGGRLVTIGESLAVGLVLLCLVAAPWVRTPTRSSRSLQFDAALGAAGAVWLVGLLVARRRPAIPGSSPSAQPP